MANWWLGWWLIATARGLVAAARLLVWLAAAVSPAVEASCGVGGAMMSWWMMLVVL